MKDNIISILSCNRFLTEKEIQKFLPPVSSKKGNSRSPFTITKRR